VALRFFHVQHFELPAQYSAYVTLAITALIGVAVRVLERKWPSIGRLLIVKGAPVYDDTKKSKRRKAVSGVPAMLAWAAWFVAHHDRFTYSEGANRLYQLNQPAALEITTDCSGSCKLLCRWSNLLHDPFDINWAPDGDTESFYNDNPSITEAQARAGDFVVMDAHLPLEFQHMVMLMEQDGTDWWVMSDGRQGAPERVRLSQDTRTKSFVRINTDTYRPIFPPEITAHPNDVQIANAGLTRLNNEEAHEAVDNGWPLWIWDGTWFAHPVGQLAQGTPEYASVHFKEKRA
jgi:hypothetical protein